MHAWAFGQACNVPDQNGNYRFPNARVVALYGVDDTPEHIQITMEKGNIPYKASSLEELFEYCNAFMILQRRGGEHVAFADEIVKRNLPVFIDKPVCCTLEDMERLQALASDNHAFLCGGSGFKYNHQIRQLKKEIEEGRLGPISHGTITYSADMDSAYDGIFFYLPHGVEVMLELFGYAWRSLSAQVHAHDQFEVEVEYPDLQVKLLMNGSKTCQVEIQGNDHLCTQIDADDIFQENMRNFISGIEHGSITKDVTQLVEHVRVILAVNAAMKTKQKINRNTDENAGHLAQ